MNQYVCLCNMIKISLTDSRNDFFAHGRFDQRRQPAQRSSEHLSPHFRAAPAASMAIMYLLDRCQTGLVIQSFHLICCSLSTEIARGDICFNISISLEAPAAGVAEDPSIAPPSPIAVMPGITFDIFWYAIIQFLSILSFSFHTYSPSIQSGPLRVAR